MACAVFLSFVAIALCTTLAKSQGMASFSGKTIIPIPVISEEELNEIETNLTFFHDSESQVYYIDFESIPVNLSHIKVYDKNHTVVFQDDLWDVPVNAIYELSVKNLKSGIYSVELSSYTNCIQKNIEVKR